MKSPIYLDVRTHEEFSQEHYPGALHHDVQDLMNGTLPDLDKNTCIKIYCRSGGRAGVATTLLQQAGFTDVENVGGLSDIV